MMDIYYMCLTFVFTVAILIPSSECHSHLHATEGARAISSPVVAFFGIITDTHYAEISSKSDGKSDYVNAIYKVKDVISHFNEHVPAPAFIMHNGDLKDFSASQEYIRRVSLTFLSRVEKEIQFFRGPIYHSIGNHDIDVNSKADFLERVINTNIPRSKKYYSFNCCMDNIHAVVLDGSFYEDGVDHNSVDNLPGFDINRDPSKYYVPEKELAWLRADLADNLSRRVVVFSHYRLDLKNHHDSVSNSEAVNKELILHGGVLAVFQGHRHFPNPWLKKINGIAYYTLRAINNAEEYPFASVFIHRDCSIQVVGNDTASSFMHLFDKDGPCLLNGSAPFPGLEYWVATGPTTTSTPVSEPESYPTSKIESIEYTFKWVNTSVSWSVVDFGMLIDLLDWNENTEWISTSDSMQNITIDLGKVVSLAAMKFRRKEERVRNMMIEISLEYDTAFTIVTDIISFSEEDPNDQIVWIDPISFDRAAIRARFVRIVIFNSWHGFIGIKDISFRLCEWCHLEEPSVTSLLLVPTLPNLYDMCVVDPGRCGPNSNCIYIPNMGVSCRCHDGYRSLNGLQNDCLSGCDVQAGNCGARSSCSLNGNEVLCTCEPGFSSITDNGANCVSLCENGHPCGKFSDCSVKNNEIHCKCWPNYFSTVAGDTNCKRNPCLKGFCGDNSICTLNPIHPLGTPTCRCMDNFLSSNGFHTDCLADPCEIPPMLCGYNSTCVRANSNVTCFCDIGFVSPSGQGDDCVSTCEIDEDFCSENSTCSMLGPLPTCHCSHGYVEFNGNCISICDTLGYNPCPGEHQFCSVEENNSLVCFCDRNYVLLIDDSGNLTGDCVTHCDVESPCGANSSCRISEEGAVQCRCDEHFWSDSGRHDDCLLGCPDNDVSMCGIGGSCRVLGNRVLCVCDAGFFIGSDGMCVSTCDMTPSICEDSHSTCSILHGTATCSCESGYKKIVSEIEGTVSCVSLCDKSLDMCEENSQCVLVDGNVTCVCTFPFVYSVEENQCVSPCYDTVCPDENEICEYSMLGTKSCTCSNEYIRRNGLCESVCAGDLCGFGAVCSIVDFSPVCTCLPGYRATSNESLALGCQSRCTLQSPCRGESATCVLDKDDPTYGELHCTCGEGFLLKSDDRTLCIAIDSDTNCQYCNYENAGCHEYLNGTIAGCRCDDGFVAEDGSMSEYVSVDCITLEKLGSQRWLYPLHGLAGMSLISYSSDGAMNAMDGDKESFWTSAHWAILDLGDVPFTITGKLAATVSHVEASSVSVDGPWHLLETENSLSFRYLRLTFFIDQPVNELAVFGCKVGNGCAAIDPCDFSPCNNATELCQLDQLDYLKTYCSPVGYHLCHDINNDTFALFNSLPCSCNDFDVIKEECFVATTLVTFTLNVDYSIFVANDNGSNRVKSGLSNILGVEPNRIIVSAIQEGSTVIKLVILPDPYSGIAISSAEVSRAFDNRTSNGVSLESEIGYSILSIFVSAKSGPAVKVPSSSCCDNNSGSNSSSTKVILPTISVAVIGLVAIIYRRQTASLFSRKRGKPDVDDDAEFELKSSNYKISSAVDDGNIYLQQPLTNDTEHIFEKHSNKDDIVLLTESPSLNTASSIPLKGTVDEDADDLSPNESISRESFQHGTENDDFVLFSECDDISIDPRFFSSTSDDENVKTSSSNTISNIRISIESTSIESFEHGTENNDSVLFSECDDISIDPRFFSSTSDDDSIASKTSSSDGSNIRISIDTDSDVYNFESFNEILRKESEDNATSNESVSSFFVDKKCLEETKRNAVDSNSINSTTTKGTSINYSSDGVCSIIFDD